MAEADGRVVAVFPDLIATLDLECGLPLSTAGVARLLPGHPLGLILAPQSQLRLGKTMQRDDLLATVAEAIGRACAPGGPRHRELRPKG